MAAQPVRIWGCFDGLVLIDAKPMHEHGVRFRDPGVNECKESQARGLPRFIQWHKPADGNRTLGGMRVARTPTRLIAWWA